MFENALAFVLDLEGGLTEDPHDPGGLTKFGISQRAYALLDIRNLTLEQAAAIYRRDFWDYCRCGELSPAIALLVFDAAVNQGPETAIRMLQVALGVSVDGRIGPQTIAAAGQRFANDLASAFVAERMFHYGCAANFKEYGRGWARRLARAHQAAMESFSA